MEFYVVSERHCLESPGWQPIYEFEDLLVDVTGGYLLAPSVRATLSVPFLSRRKKIFDPIVLPQGTGAAPKVLFVVAHDPMALNIVMAIPGWRRMFDVVAAFVTEPFCAWGCPKIEGQIDHFFVPQVEDLEPVKARTNKPVSLLGSATDVLTHANIGADRAIDVVSYGRMPVDLRRALQERFNDPGSGRIFLHSPFGIGRGKNWQRDRRLFWKLLKISKVALCFDTTEPGMRAMPHMRSLLTPRWFECLAAGCVTAGVRPTASLTATFLDWEDAIVDLPSTIDGAIKQIEMLADDVSRLEALRRRAHGHLLQRHDWRHRIVDALDALSLSSPPKLRDDLARLDKLAAEHCGQG